MGKLFGTDGIRGLAGREPITPEMGIRLGRALVSFCRLREKNPTVVIGRDTRISGEILEDALLSGISSAGGKACRLGVLPTPGVAYLTKKLHAGAGVMVSASHNPYEYNGFKVFLHTGFKPSDSEEAEIEQLVLSTPSSPSRIDPEECKWMEIPSDQVERYASFLESTFPQKIDIKGIKIVLDCANGAVYRIAPALFERLGAETETMFLTPDGKNINKDCGSQHTKSIRQKVIKTGADVGLSFDGDGDRLIAVDEQGEALTGDQILTICAKMLKERGQLKSNLVISTVMSNIGLTLALKQLGIDHISTDVGDRKVMEEMKNSGAILGGEDSGHIIFYNHHTTGDGLLTALQLLSAMKELGQPLSRLSNLMTLFPQTLINIDVGMKPVISTIPELVNVIKEVERKLGKKGRVLVRYSGTEPVCRVMVEGEDQVEIGNYAREIGDVIRRHLTV